MIDISEIPSEILDKWHTLVNGLANFLKIDVAFITLINQDHGQIQLLEVSDKNQLNYEKGLVFKIIGTFCEKTIKKKTMHQVHDAMSIDEWKHTTLNTYLGVPLLLPDGKVFGTFCIENRETRRLNDEELEFMKNFGELIQAHLHLLCKNKELVEKIEKIKILEKILPICCECKKIRNEKDEWIQLESYISEKTDSMFTHGYCSECSDRLLDDL